MYNSPEAENRHTQTEQWWVFCLLPPAAEIEDKPSLPKSPFHMDTNTWDCTYNSQTTLCFTNKQLVSFKHPLTTVSNIDFPSKKTFMHLLHYCLQNSNLYFRTRQQSIVNFFFFQIQFPSVWPSFIRFFGKQIWIISFYMVQACIFMNKINVNKMINNLKQFSSLINTARGRDSARGVLSLYVRPQVGV